ncbi:MAG: TIGR02652 family protein [Leptolyngbyaceae cyanobacterium CSU_1_3]|nr:TIGR02652 family protein [Leptolyngbyaceae cyanobacterium CSU_1_3]
MRHRCFTIFNRVFDVAQILGDYPIFGSEIHCPQCHRTIPALFLTDTYICPQHGAFEANPTTHELIHVQSERSWRQWENQWHRQHLHPDGLRFEIAEALDRLYREGYRATQIIIAHRCLGTCGSICSFVARQYAGKPGSKLCAVRQSERSIRTIGNCAICAEKCAFACRHGVWLEFC